MKTTILLALLLVPMQAYGWGVVNGQVVEEGGECVEEVSFGVSGAVVSTVARSAATNEYVVHEFTAGNWSDITKVQLYLEDTGDVGGQTWTIQLYSDDSGDPNYPNTYITDGSCTFSGTDFGTGAKYYGCILTSPISLVNSSIYWVGVNRQGAVDFSNFMEMYSEDAGTLTLARSVDEATYTPLDFTSTVTAKFYSGAACTAD